MAEEKTGNALGDAIAAAAGAWIGTGGTNRNNGGSPAVTADQMDSRFNSLQATMDTNALRGQGTDQTIALGLGIAGVKDAIVAGQAQTNLALCGIGNSITSGNAAVIQAVNAQGEAQKLLMVQQALDTERQRATDLRIQLSEQKNDAGHMRTLVAIQANASASSGN